MGAFLQQMITLLTVPPANLAYHAVLAFTILGALQASINHWRSSGFPQGRRMVVGLFLLLLMQLIMFGGSGLAWQRLADAHRLIPPLDRTAALLGVIILIWLWGFPETTRLADAGFLLLGMLGSAASLMGAVWWQTQDPALFYNGSWADVISSSVTLLFLLMGMLIMIFRRPNAWGFGLGMLGLLFAGHLAHWLTPLENSDFAGAVRLAEMAAFPLLLALPQRFALPAEDRTPTGKEKNKTPEIRRYSTDPKVMQAFLALAGEDSPKKFYQDMARTISQLMLADICLLATPPDDSGQMVVPVGYNLIQDRPLEGFVLDQRQSPVLTSALRRGRMLRLPSSSTSPELVALAKALDVNRVGHLMAVPLGRKGQAPMLGVILLSPYSNRGWTAEDLQYLSDATETLASILHRMQKISEQQAEIDQAQQTLQETQGQVEQARHENESLAAHLFEMQTKVNEERSRSESLAALVNTQDGSQDRDLVGSLQARVQELEALLDQPSKGSQAEVQHLEAQLRMALEDVTVLRTALQDADQHLLSTDRPAGGPGRSAEDLELVTFIAQELRQPVSSIIGYTDLLLGESVGILGAMQRKFVERVKASTERMSGLLEDLLQAATLQSSSASINPVAVDLNAVIDEAVAGVIIQMSEKNITLRVSLPDELPPVHADADALQQVVANLLQNAGGASPQDGEILLSARVELKENEAGYVLLQVSDSGSGIAPEDLPRLFSRLYRTENAVLQGVGDNGVGLALAKTLVEAQGGRIWADSEVGRGSTFSVLLPLAEGDIPA